jgi:hypothetical protein
MRVFEKVKEIYEDHAEMVRYFLPDKRISPLYKVLNFISCDRLRRATIFPGMQLHQVKRRYEDVVEIFEDDWSGYSEKRKEEILLTWLELLGEEIDEAIKEFQDIYQM